MSQSALTKWAVEKQHLTAEGQTWHDLETEAGRLQTHTRGKPIRTDDQMAAWRRGLDLAPGFWLE